MNNSSRELAPNTCATGWKKPVPQPPQELWCEQCGDPASANDWIDGLGALLCPTCLETLMDAPKETL